MSKDVNIHVKTQGTQQVQQDLQGVTQGVNKVGDNVEQMGSRSSRAMEWFTSGIKSLIGPLGFAAIVASVASAAGKIAEFFDNIKTRCDEAVNRLIEVRKGFQDIFEAMNAFDEKSRRQITQDTARLLQETSVSQETGLPVINAYTRQFRGKVESGQITEEQYNRGLKEMLGYAERHGKAATPELITLMAGWGMNTPEQQGAFRRQIGVAAGKAGSDEEDIIAALGRNMPTAKAMGWTPEKVLENISILSAGETGRKKLSLPSTTMEAMINPNITDIGKKYGISESVASDPSALFSQISVMNGKMDRTKYMKMLTDIYGSSDAAAGVYKLVTAQRTELTKSLKDAATQTAAKAEQNEELTSQDMLERIRAKTNATILVEQLKPGIDYDTELRRIGEETQKRYKKEHPYRQWWREHHVKGVEAKKEDAAYQQWRESLTAQDESQIRNEWIRESTEPDVKSRPEAYRNSEDPFIDAWKQRSPEQRYEELTRRTGDMHIHYHHDMNYFPVAGTAADRDMGPRAGRDLK